MVSKTGLRAFFAGLMVLSVLAVGFGYATAASETTFEQHLDANGVTTNESIAPPRDNITVVATDSNSWRGQMNEGPRSRAELVAFAPNGSVMYYNDSHTRYWDVDPVPGTTATVEYSYADHLDPNQCPTSWNASDYGVDEETWNTYLEGRGVNACTRNGFERVNLTTGEVTDVWSQHTPGKEATRYHDIDRINDTHVAVADIYLDRVFIANTETDEVVWSWNASEEFSTSKTGGPFPKDWSHINDVEVLDDGRLMISSRNHDRVLFIDRERGLLKNWTVGEENNYDVLYEQHNPDYIPRENGGPAIVVADSENNRVLEYQRENGEWTKTWSWRDARMQWPRDADRLPNDHTLVADSNGNRVFEANAEGNVVWSVNVAFPYEVERLGTGDESTNGTSAQQAGLATRTGGFGDQFWIGIKSFIPGKYLNGLMYITPVWLGIPELFAIFVFVMVGFVWVGVEGWWFARRKLDATETTPDERVPDQD